MIRRTRVGINGYGVISKRAADAVKLQDDMHLVGIADVGHDQPERKRDMSLETICLLGGYGDVGLRLARLLHARCQARIVLAGRDGERAGNAAREIGPRCEGMALDIRAADAIERLRDMTLCVNLTEASPPALAAALIAGGSHFIDSSASPDYVAALRDAIGKVTTPQATAVLATGLAPGLTNLIAARLCRAHPDIRRIDVLIEMGMGVHHGFAATEWTLHSLGQTYPVKMNGQWHEVRTGTLNRSFDTETRRIDAIGFAFSDQQDIARDHALDGARTFLAVDPGWITPVLRWLSRPAPSAFVRRHAATLARWMLRTPTMGGFGTRLAVEAFDADGNILGEEYLSDGPQADLTAAVLAETVLALTQPGNHPGLRTLGSVLNAWTFIANENDRAGSLR